METLIFQLNAPLSSWGETAVGEYRPTAGYPSQSAIQGLLAAALGIDRHNESSQQALYTGYRLAVGVLSQGRLLRDYHTSQVPSQTDLKKRPHATRRDELLVPKNDLNTILSTRDYRQDATALVAVQMMENAPYSLLQLVDALKKPKFVLYLGRKSCPISVPLNPCILTETTINAAFIEYQQVVANLNKNISKNSLQKIAWGDNFGIDDLTTIGLSRSLSTIRKDRVITRQGWQFADRTEHIALLEKE